MMTNNAQSPKVGSSVKTFEEWKQENPTLVQKLDEQQLREAYEQYKRSAGGQQQSLTNPETGIQDVSEDKQTTELNNKKPVNNIDMMGVTDTFTQLGIATGNQTMTKAGILGNSTVKALQQLKATKGMTGAAKTAGVTGAVGGLADTADQMFFGDQAAKNSALTNGLNTGYDAVSSAIMTMGPYGAIIGGAMKIGGLLSDGLTAMGVGTDQMTTADQILDSKFLKLTPVGLVNAIGASSTDKFAVDNSVRSQIGGSYGGAYSFMDDAASKAGKKYGLFSSGARNDANEQIGKAKVMQGKIGRINKDARDKQSIVDNTSDLLSTNYQFNLAGGYDQRYIRAAKEGSKIERIKKINLTFRKGGQLHNVINLETKEVEWQPVIIEDEIPEFKNGGNIEWQYNSWEPTIVEDEWQPTIVDFFEEGGKAGESGEEPTNQKNVIPEGALHARKHHMENTEGLTQKGIPVIDDKGEQQAEIELNEIIFNLEVTQKLEELCKDGSDEAAIEAGKLLVQEILFNTEDRTGLIKTLKQGGTINGSTE